MVEKTTEKEITDDADFLAMVGEPAEEVPNMPSEVGLGGATGNDLSAIKYINYVLQ